MLKKQEKRVGAYTKELLHFGTITTQRVEGAHAVIKNTLNSSGSLGNALARNNTCIPSPGISYFLFHSKIIYLLLALIRVK